MLSSQQIADFREQGFLVVENVFSPTEIAALVAETEEIMEEARHLSANNAVYDLEESHSAKEPRVRRIKSPHKVSSLYLDTVRDSRILGMAGSLIGPDIRLRGAKLNTKLAGFGAAVEWHQDWAYFPSTNDDHVTISLMLDEMTESNGTLMFLPGSHRGPTLDHHADGRFCGAIDMKRSEIDLANVVKMIGPAGSVIIHHVRVVHGSDINRSTKSRRLLLCDLAAADSWPLVGSYLSFKTLEDFDERIIAGSPTIRPRITDVPVYMPLPGPNDPDSVYTVQRDLKNRYFNEETKRTNQPPA